MEKPSVEQAPDGWLTEIVEASKGLPDQMDVTALITSADDGKQYSFTYDLGEVRAEHERRHQKGIVH